MPSSSDTVPVDAEPVAAPDGQLDLIPVVDIQLPLNGAEALVLAFDSSGKQVEVPARIVIQPFFPREESSGLAAYLTLRVAQRADLAKLATDEADRQRATLRVGGKTGRLTLVDRTKRRQPAFLLNK